MKLKAILLFAMLLAPQSVSAQQVNIYNECRSYKIVEEYVPGYYTQYGTYVGGYVRTTKVKVPCSSDPYIVPIRPVRPYPRYYDNCIDRREIVGGTVGLLFGC